MRAVRSMSVLVVALCMAVNSTGAEFNPLQNQISSPNAHRVLVKFRGGAGSVAVVQAESVPDAVANLASRANLSLRRSRQILGGLHVIEFEPRTAGESLAASLARLRADSSVEYAEPDQRRHVQATIPNDPLFVATSGATGQWYMQSPSSAGAPSAVDAVDAWGITTGSAGVVIADIDTGIRFDHPDLLRAGAGGRLLPGYDFVSDVSVGNEANGPNSDASDPGDWITQADTQTSEFSGCAVSNSSWHGTRVTGILGALTNNSVGVAGMTWSGWMLPVRALGKCGGLDSDIETAMLWAAGVHQSGVPDNPYPAKIVNLSLGGSGSCPQSYQTIISQLTQLGVLVVASAGNEGGPVSAPANCPGVAAIAGLRQIGTKVGYSNLGTEVALSAPAGNCVNTSGPCLYSIDTTVNAGTTTPAPYTASNAYTNQTNYNVGTSFSAPMVSGIAGLMVAVNGNLTPAQLIARLQEGVTTPFPVSTDSSVPLCHVPASSSDVQAAECNCTTSTCGAGMANALGAVTAALRPIAAVAVPGSVSAGANVVLNGSGSAAACNQTISSWAWSLVSGSNTSGTTPTISGAGSSAATVVAPSSGSFQIQLTVTDSAGKTDTAVVTISASAASTSAPSNASNNGSTACLTAISPTLPITVSVSPSGPSVQAGLGSQTFTATVTSAPNTNVTWEVNGIAGGNSTVGTISGAGVYTAPANIPTSPTVTVTAVSAADSTVSGFAGVTITAPVAVVVSPSTATVLAGTGTQSFAATVTNTSNTALTWEVNGIAGGNSTVGTISSAGLYTAPAKIPSPATVTVTAVSAADPTRSGTAQVTIAHVAVAVLPGSASVATGATQSFVASVSNTTNTGVTWQVNAIAGGNSTFGMISSSGVYTAPATVPSPAMVTVTAVSVADPNQSGSATVTVTSSSAGSTSGSSSSGSGSSSSGSGSSSSGSGSSSSGAGSSGGGGGGFDPSSLIVLAGAWAARRFSQAVRTAGAGRRIRS
jgi:serine protease